jgi:hypothetical protein
MVDMATFDNMLGSLREYHTITFITGGLLSNTVDAGPGRSFVGIEIETALTAATSLTFKGSADEDDSAGTVLEVKVENNDGSAAAAYTVLPADTVGYYPLDPAIFNGLRHLTIVSNQAGNATKSVKLVSKPL